MPELFRNAVGKMPPAQTMTALFGRRSGVPSLSISTASSWIFTTFERKSTRRRPAASASSIFFRFFSLARLNASLR